MELECSIKEIFDFDFLEIRKELLFKETP